MAYHKLQFLAVGALLFLVGAFALQSIATSVAAAQTIPTRTPTPSGGGATATSEGGSEDPGPPDPGPNSTAQATLTRTTFTPIPLPPTPEEGFLPTAAPCDLQPSLRSLASGINVREGPGLAYEIVGRLLLREVRPVVGRAAHVEWWRTILADGTIGWAADNLVEVHGYTGDVEIIPAPPLPNGATATPGTPWAPTPRPECTPPATATSTPTSTPRATGTATPTAGIEENEGSIEGTSEETAIPPVTGSATLATAELLDESPEAIATPFAEPLPGETNRAGNMPWIPIAGVGLILVAAAIFVVQRVRT